MAGVFLSIIGTKKTVEGSAASMLSQLVGVAIIICIGRC